MLIQYIIDSAQNDQIKKSLRLRKEIRSIFQHRIFIAISITQKTRSIFIDLINEIARFELSRKNMAISHIDQVSTS